MLKSICLTALVLFGCILYGSADDITPDPIKPYMETQSLIWEKMPLQWNEGAPLGNGLVGMMVYVDTLDNSLTIWLSRPDVTDHRGAPNRKTSRGIEGTSVNTDFCRLDIGKMKIYPQAKIVSGTMELDIYNGELRGILKTDKGDISLLALTPYPTEINALRFDTKVPLNYDLIAGPACSPRLLVFPFIREQINYIDNPGAVNHNDGEEGTSIYTLLAGGDFATYWKVEKDGDQSTLWISTKNEVPSVGKSLPAAKAEVGNAINRGFETLRMENSHWWNDYYKTGLISIPDKQMENFYHIQLYKLATCSHPEGPTMDNFGTFYKTSQWPGVWWNLNVQLTYMSTMATNRLAQAENFIKLMDDQFLDILEASHPAKTGDYVWALHTWYNILRFKGINPDQMGERFLEKARALFARYRPHMEDSCGIINLIGMESPEYNGFDVYDNSNYNLAALRWLAQAMIDAGDMSQGDFSPSDILNRLHDYPIDVHGFRIGENQAVDKSHRHYSHLLAFYPLKLIDATIEENQQMLRKSVDWWTGIGEGKELTGFSYSGAASMYATAHDGDQAWKWIHHFLNKPIGISLFLPSTMYVESNGRNPTLETPLSIATAMTEMLIQTQGGVLRLFPAIPAEWENCSFNKLRAEGGFVISSEISNGKIQWMEITNEGNNSCTVYLPDWSHPINVDRKESVIENLGNGYFKINLAKGNTALLADKKNLKIKSFSPEISTGHFFGVKDKNLPYLMDWPDHP